MRASLRNRDLTLQTHGATRVPTRDSASMTVKLKLKDVKDKLREDTLDLSLCDLEEVPVREIASLRKATNVNLSTNLLVSLPATFVTLKQIVKLDLSRNMLVELPENFGEMTQLKHLDLYANKISRLPLSLSELKNLRWLDLKENPLTEAVASVAGPCSNMRECQACARNIVTYLSNVKLVIEEERLRRLNNVAGDAGKEVASTKKEGKRKRKRNVEREKVNGNKSDSPTQSEGCSRDNSDSVRLMGSSSNNTSVHKSCRSTDDPENTDDSNHGAGDPLQSPGVSTGGGPLREQDRFLPIANVAKIMKRAIPEAGKIAKDARECVQECVSEFISFITSEASDRCHMEKRKTINGEDILFAMTTLGFDNYVEPLKVYLQKYREATKGDNPPNAGATTGNGKTEPQNMYEDQLFAITATASSVTTSDSSVIYSYSSNDQMQFQLS